MRTFRQFIESMGSGEVIFSGKSENQPAVRSKLSQQAISSLWEKLYDELANGPLANALSYEDQVSYTLYRMLEDIRQRVSAMSYTVIRGSNSYLENYLIEVEKKFNNLIKQAALTPKEKQEMSNYYSSLFKKYKAKLIQYLTHDKRMQSGQSASDPDLTDPRSYYTGKNKPNDFT